MRHFARLLLTLAFALPLQAQEQIPEFDKLRTPASPAFIILGTTPAQVERPTTPSTFAVNLLQGFAPSGDAEGLDDFAVEVAPYWLKSHPGLQWHEYHTASWWQNLVRSTTLSLATVSVEDQATVSGRSRDLGLGLRARVFQSRNSAPDTTCAARVSASVLTLSGLSRAVALEASKAIARDSTIVNDTAAMEVVRGRAFEAALTALSADERKIATERINDCTDILSVRRGFIVDGAGALAWRFPNSQAEAGQLRSGALWVTPSYVGRNVSVAGVVRYRWSEDPDAENLLDVGARGVYAWDRYGASLEGVIRHPTVEDGGDDLYRLSVILDVKLTGDVWLTTSFGRDFTADDADSVIALASLQWNVGDRSVQPDLGN